MDDFAFNILPTRLGCLYIAALCLLACLAVCVSFQPWQVKLALFLLIALLAVREFMLLLVQLRPTNMLRYWQNSWQVFYSGDWKAGVIVNVLRNPLVIVLVFEVNSIDWSGSGCRPHRQRIIIWRDALSGEDWRRLIVYLNIV